MSKLTALFRRIAPHCKLISSVLVLAGLSLFLVFPLDELHDTTSISEHGLMPDYANMTYRPEYQSDVLEYSGSISSAPNLPQVVLETLSRILRLPKNAKLRSTAESQVVYGWVEAERSDGTESLAIVAPIHLDNGQPNICGVSHALALAKAFKDLKFWTKDVIFIFPENGSKDLDHWLAQYHSGSTDVLRRGSLQMAIGLEIPGSQCQLGLDSAVLHIEGPNGLLPNLDFVSAAVKIAEAHELPVTFPSMFPSNTRFVSRLQFMVSMLLRQAFGFPKHIARSFLKYRIEALTIEGREAFPRENQEYHSRKFKSSYEVLEGVLRCMNNVIERLHQSYFFYVLLDNRRFVPLASIIAVPLLISGALAFKALAFLYSAESSEVHLELGICLVSFLCNLTLWNLASILPYNHAIAAFLVFITVALVWLNWLLVRRYSPNKTVLKGCATAILAIAVLATSFLNMGLAIILGIVSWLAVALNDSVGLFRLLLLPSTILLAAYLRAPYQEYAKEIATGPLDWNFGIPFVVIQPVFIQLLTAKAAHGEAKRIMKNPKQP